MPWDLGLGTPCDPALRPAYLTFSLGSLLHLLAIANSAVIQIQVLWALLMLLLLLGALRYASNQAFFGIELLNEPGAADVPLNVMEYYYTWGYSTVRKHSSTAYVIMCQRIGANFAELVNVLPADNVVLDVHCYNLFNSALFNHTTAQWNINYVYNDRRSLIQGLNAAGNALIFVGKLLHSMNCLLFLPSFKMEQHNFICYVASM